MASDLSMANMEDVSPNAQSTTQQLLELRRHHPRRRHGFGFKTSTIADHRVQDQEKGKQESDVNTDEDEQSQEPEQIEETDSLGYPVIPVQYECAICLDEFSLNEGVVTCAEHFFCKDCITKNFKLAVQGQFSSFFPVQCCVKAAGSRRPATVLRRRFEHILSPEVSSAYARKETEHFTPTALKLYCVECRAFLPPKTFTNQGAYTIAACNCGITMCVGCKGLWQNKHRCISKGDPLARPDWLPEYTHEFRVKKCPGCKMYIEHESACNHMTCQYCRHQFCFVCLLPWSPDDNDWCPMYGDPVCGYDDEGYEKSERRLHRDTGLTCDGLDRKGNAPTINEVAGFDAGEEWDAYWREENNVGWEDVEWEDFENDENDENDEPQLHVDPEELADREYRAALDDTFQDALWSHPNLWTAISQADVVPVWSVPLMFQEYEKMVLENDPFYYGELEIFEMFAEAEKELSNEWYVHIENVGLAGVGMTFNMNDNRFAPLFWDDRD